MGSARCFPFALSLMYRGGFDSSISKKGAYSRAGGEGARSSDQTEKHSLDLTPTRMALQKRVTRSTRWSHLEDRLYEHVQEAVRLSISLDMVVGAHGI